MLQTYVNSMDLQQKIKILADGAKYDVSCSSSGSNRANQKGGIGNASVCGICHSFTPDGRCISLLKILLSNNCCFDCLYCLNRKSNDIPRASLEPRELCELTINLYKRNYIEGLFLSSAIEYTPNNTMEKLLTTVVMLRRHYNFNGYIHLKAIPHSDPKLIHEAAKYADRISVNIELPTSQGLKLLAPSKTKDSIIKPMRQLSLIYQESQEQKNKRNAPLPAGQTTQLIIGATPDSDGTILKLSEALYRIYSLKRVYYSAYVPIGTSSLLPATPPNTLRENRLYQADWLIRFYGFNADELGDENSNLNYLLDPKTDWALRNMARFPIEINTAPYEELLRVPGIGVKGAWRIMQSRKVGSLTWEDLKRMRITLKRAKHFITVKGKFEGIENYSKLSQNLIEQSSSRQISMFDSDQGLLTGEL